MKFLHPQRRLHGFPFLFSERDDFDRYCLNLYLYICVCVCVCVCVCMFIKPALHPWNKTVLGHEILSVLGKTGVDLSIL